ncbi:hypothetical protein PHYBLDRAFT_139383 [Phycomyces blakesleeanus NRRL 1555(-)]|uniref:Uncharacterized protein n=1 Tax=Phycomyces blakesleeanus (strain ATCC 8743b / DSM 1359 / FGSC 10004 / NBRC 33097 / NRRL 1555) TaxID=763407 RepID=A0A163ELP6_PHYB8|nr:hypothetical protein PHYBLDRAFT_139383 [Phycomyces blakesleeanus NRRL 1555(-)]OAD79350.1 hypothetical protein PHYBLDRAFT_139383 [Phycomyces blakesleeanus NRRL 1555(-)]|eukprot:XP_018297390.1 hypothetical protein PHYBLDRAFT_139383 [Phycomyces blakesleeanus NRRL 1555(-)]
MTAPITTYATYAPTNQQPFQLQQFSLKESTMSNIDYPQLLDNYKIVYAMPNLISYHDVRLSQYFYLFIHSFTLPPHPNHQASTLHQDQHVFAYIRWYNLTNDNEHRDEGIAICLPEFSADNYYSILPVHRIHLEVATVVDVTDMNEERMLVIPMPKKYCA